MNERAYRLTGRLRSVLGTLPGASSISLHCFETWALVIITASSDEAVVTLGEELGLGAFEVGHSNGRWWRRAMAERDRGTLRVEVTGPHHLGAPPCRAAGEVFVEPSPELAIAELQVSTARVRDEKIR